MQSYSEAEQNDAKAAVEAARQHIEADLHAEMRGLREELRELKALLLHRLPDESDQCLAPTGKV
jgi:voltage-gated sodium channel